LRLAQKVDIVVRPNKTGGIPFKKSPEAAFFTIVFLFCSFILGFLSFVMIALWSHHSISSPVHVPVTGKCEILGHLTT
jgi:hypothetical protein